MAKQAAIKTVSIDSDTNIDGCLVSERPDGSILVCFVIEPVAARRYQKRRGTMDLGRYLWENVIKRNVVDSVF